MFNYQSCEADYDVCYDVIGQYDEYCCNQICYCINKISKVDFCYVVQYQQVNVYQCWSCCIFWNEVREWREEQNQQEQYVNGDSC